MTNDKLYKGYMASNDDGRFVRLGEGDLEERSEDFVKYFKEACMLSLMRCRGSSMVPTRWSKETYCNGMWFSLGTVNRSVIADNIDTHDGKFGAGGDVAKRPVLRSFAAPGGPLWAFDVWIKEFNKEFMEFLNGQFFQQGVLNNLLEDDPWALKKETREYLSAREKVL